jgi:hypothetical protein
MTLSDEFPHGFAKRRAAGVNSSWSLTQLAELLDYET